MDIRFRIVTIQVDRLKVFRLKVGDQSTSAVNLRLHPFSLNPFSLSLCLNP